MLYTDNLILQTERLMIQPLSYSQLQKYSALNNLLEEELGLNAYPRTVPIELKEALEQFILPQAAQLGSSFIYATLWTIVDKQQKIMMADLCFKGLPNEQGEIEIGYGTYTDFRGKGYMTEAIGAVVQWAFIQPGIKSIIAETDNFNSASHKTLARNGFTVYNTVENMTWWRLDK